MGHDRRAHTRRYPMINGYRKPGRVSVRGAHVNDSEGSPADAACGCCLLTAVGLVVLGAMLVNWIKDIFN